MRVTQQRACQLAALGPLLAPERHVSFVDGLIRFLLGGAVVSFFAALGSAFKPKTFAGLFGSAPTVALGSLALTFGQHGSAEVASLARSMIIAAPALLAYSLVCVLVVKRHGLPVWLAAALAWTSWGLVAAGLFWSVVA
ncbi:MAG TPA: hypothetical protein VHB79_01340 [Polyangiaceae bacterium]|nr:hypothetical protein [Polyangiaceae bacterium]